LRGPAKKEEEKKKYKKKGMNNSTGIQKTIRELTLM